jgi:2-(1,2-epoxy-1,2-dihydrophenyl)acetyl-CoA isomerase
MSDVSTNSVELDVADGIATITLNRPQRQNSLSSDLCRDLVAALEAATDCGHRCLVIEGAGSAFSAGGDIQEISTLLDDAASVDEAMRTISDAIGTAIRSVAAHSVPTIAKIDGVAAGGGAGLALACDVQLASERARIGFVFRNIGLCVDSGVSYFLPRIVGTNTAKELVFTGEILDAERAASLGLFNHVYDVDEFDSATSDFVRTVADGPTIALRHSKRLLDAGLDTSLRDATDAEFAAQTIALDSEDHEEGVEAFLEDRRPEFAGR